MSAWSKAWKKTGWRKFARNTLYFYCAAHVLVNNFGEFIVCKGDSMLPTLRDGDIILAEKRSVKRRNLWKGDIVCATDPYNHQGLICKRIAHGPLDEIESHQTYEAPLNRVPPGHCFLTGDNEAVSNDSRNFGPVPIGLVQVRMVYRLFPLNRAGWLSNHAYNDETHKI